MKSISVIENDRDRRTKTTKINIGQKEVNSPNFCTRIKNREELNAYIKFYNKMPLPYASTCIFRYYDAPYTIFPLQKGNLYDFVLPSMRIKDDPTKKFLESVPILIDPATDSLYYSSEIENFLQKGLHLEDRMRKYVLDYQNRNRLVRKRRLSRADVNKWRNKNHNRFWYNIRDNDNYRIKFIENMLQEQIKFGADIPIAPTPLITSKELLKISIIVNEKSKEVAKSMNETCATSFYLPSNVLSKDDMLAIIVNYVIKFDKNNPLTVFKFKNLDLTHSNKILERDNYRTLKLDLDDISRMYKNKLFMVLENGKQVFTSSLVGFHIVSSGSDGWDMTGGGKSSGPYGSWYDTETMTFRSYEKDVKKIFKEIGRLPCDCIICRKYRKPPTVPYIWNIDRKLHHIVKRNEDNAMIVKDIDRKDILHAVDKLGRSQISILRKTLPY